MNWGYKIMIVYLAFAAGIATLVIKSFSQKIDLVTSDYYAKELVHQEKIDAVSRTAALSSKPAYTLSGNTLRLTLPVEFESKQTHASVLLYCPSDDNKDIQKNISTSNRDIIVDLPAHLKGAYIIQVNWITDGLAYYFEERTFF